MGLHSRSFGLGLGIVPLALILLSGAESKLHAQLPSAPMHMGMLQVQSTREPSQAWRRHKVLRLGVDSIHLGWDVIHGDGQQLYYLLEHCTADGQPSAIEPYEAIEGTHEMVLQHSAYSQGTITPYLRYQLSLPNEHTRPVRSGLYRLSIYAQGADPSSPLMRYYYSVAEEESVQMSGQVQDADWIGRRTGHHYIEATITLPTAWAQVREDELQISVLQNGQPVPTSTPLPLPLRRSAIELSYSERTAISVPAGGRYTPLEWSKRHSSARGISHLSHSPLGLELLVDELHSGGDDISHYQSDQDGRYIPYSLDADDHSTQGEYGWATFRYRSAQLGPEHLVMLEGEAFDHLPRSARTLSCDPTQGLYQLRIPIKQGQIEYRYATISPRDTSLSYEHTTGLHWEQAQQYTLLLYYHPIGERAPRLIATLEL